MSEHFLVGAGSLQQYALDETAHTARLREQEAACQMLEAELLDAASADRAGDGAYPALLERQMRLRAIEAKAEKEVTEFACQLVDLRVLQTESERTAHALRAGDGMMQGGRTSYLATLRARQAELDAKIAEEEAAIAAVDANGLREPVMAAARAGPSLLHKRRRTQQTSALPSTSHTARIDGQGSSGAWPPRAPQRTTPPEASQAQARHGVRRRNDAIADFDDNDDFQ
jgi:hypothetical protein